MINKWEKYKWIYNNVDLEAVDNLNYLGTVFNYTCNFNLYQEHLAGKALKAINVLLIKCKKYNIEPDKYYTISIIWFICRCNCEIEIWANIESKKIEQMHLKFCNRVLKGNNKTKLYGCLWWNG
jgi:hypothetical protein